MGRKSRRAASKKDEKEVGDENNNSQSGFDVIFDKAIDLVEDEDGSVPLETLVCDMKLEDKEKSRADLYRAKSSIVLKFFNELSEVKRALLESIADKYEVSSTVDGFECKDIDGLMQEARNIFSDVNGSEAEAARFLGVHCVITTEPGTRAPRYPDQGGMDLHPMSVEMRNWWNANAEQIRYEPTENGGFGMLFLSDLALEMMMMFRYHRMVELALKKIIDIRPDLSS